MARCPLCGGQDAEVAHVGELYVRDLRVRQETRVCLDCSMTFEVSDPDLDWSSLYGEVWHRSPLPNAKQRGLYRSDAELIGRPADDRGRVFDIGCGSGLLLDELAALGWCTAGCDPEESAIQAAREKGHEVVADLYRPEYVGEADLVVLGDVLEHVPDPLEMLRSIRGAIRSESRFYVRVPNLADVNFETFGDVFGLQHRVWFTADTLREMLAVAGFAIEGTGTYPRGMRALTRCAEPRGWRLPAGEPDRSIAIIRQYSSDMRERRSRIAERLETLDGREVALYGAGEHAEELLQASCLGRIASRIVDSNEKLWGRSCGSIVVEPPSGLRARLPDSVVIASKAYQDEIAEQLADLADRGVEIVRLYARGG